MGPMIQRIPGEHNELDLTGNLLKRDRHHVTGMYSGTDQVFVSGCTVTPKGRLPVLLLLRSLVPSLHMLCVLCCLLG